MPRVAPASLLVLVLGGRWTRRNGRGEACAARRQLRVKADSEARSATTGGFSVAVAVAVVVGYSGVSLSELGFLGRRERGRDESGAARLLVVLACLYTTPSSSRKYAGPIFLFSALHCARMRRRRRLAVVSSHRGAGKEGGG